MASRSFSSMADLAAHLASFPSRMADAKAAALDEIGKQAVAAAKDRIGKYQDQAGPFPAWPHLSQYTIQDRIDQGYTPNDPLLRTGELRDSIRSEINGNTLTIGSSDPIAGYQEHGTEDRFGGHDELGTDEPLGHRHEEGIEHYQFGHESERQAGTIPPRPFVGPAMVEAEGDAKDLLRVAVGKALDG